MGGQLPPVWPFVDSLPSQGNQYWDWEPKKQQLLSRCLATRDQWTCVKLFRSMKVLAHNWNHFFRRNLALTTFPGRTTRNTKMECRLEKWPTWATSFLTQSYPLNRPTLYFEISESVFNYTYILLQLGFYYNFCGGSKWKDTGLRTKTKVCCQVSSSLLFFCICLCLCPCFVSCFLLMPIVNFEKYSEWGLKKLHRVASREEREEGYEGGEQLISIQSLFSFLAWGDVSENI